MVTGTGKFKLLLLAVVAAIAISCQPEIMYFGHFDFRSNEWNRQKTVRFEAEITDTLSAARVDINLRTGSDYPYRNIYLFVSTFAPGGERITDTLEYMLADEKGRRYGRGRGDIRELNLSYRDNVYFPRKGTYMFLIEHAMRTESLTGVYDIGIKISRQEGKRR
ncbi:MAG: gliding motility lipoprotein GldH [Bacteroidales bacterium]